MRIVFKTSHDADIRLWKHGAQLFWYLLLLAAAVALPLLLDDFMLGEATNVLVWAIAGMGLMLLVGHAGQASLGHAAWLALGAYADTLLQTRAGLPFLMSLPLAAVISGLVAALVTLPIMRLHGIYLAIATLALSVLTEDIIILAEPWTGGVSGLFAPDIEIFGINFNRYTNPDGLYWLVLAITVLITLGYANLLRAPTGRAFVAVRDSEISARAMGVHVARTKTLAFALSAAVTAVAGALMGHMAGVFNNETFNIVISIYLLMMIVIGGLGSIHGAFLGALVIGFLPQAIALLRSALAGALGIGSITIPGLETAIFGAILVAFLLFEPRGIYGRWIVIRTWFELFPFYRRDMFRRQRSYLKTERMR